MFVLISSRPGENIKKMPWVFMQLQYKRKFYRVALNFK